MTDVAARSATSPAAARRAAAVLGAVPALDALDAVLVAALRRHDPFARIDRVDADGAGADWRLAWGMDGGRQEVWLPTGERVELGSKPLLWRLLAVLAERGAASKEELVLGAWDVREYHPLRHDNRLQVAMRKLRRSIEIDPSRPERVVTTDEGYALSGPVLFERAPARLSELPPRMR
jgi:DNA-binding response OmpR family regulator